MRAGIAGQWIVEIVRTIRIFRFVDHLRFVAVAREINIAERWNEVVADDCFRRRPSDVHFATIVMRVLLWMRATFHVNYGWVLVLFGVVIRLALWFPPCRNHCSAASRAGL